MNEVKKVVKVTGTIGRLEITDGSKGYTFFVYLDLKGLSVREKSDSKKAIRILQTRGNNYLLCRMFREASPDLVWKLMPGKKVSLEGVLVSQGPIEYILVSSKLTQDGDT